MFDRLQSLLSISPIPASRFAVAPLLRAVWQAPRHPGAIARFPVETRPICLSRRRVGGAIVQLGRPRALVVAEAPERFRSDAKRGALHRFRFPLPPRPSRPPMFFESLP